VTLWVMSCDGLGVMVRPNPFPRRNSFDGIETFTTSAPVRQRRRSRH
jgi:hypothetical protein